LSFSSISAVCELPVCHNVSSCSTIVNDVHERLALVVFSQGFKTGFELCSTSCEVF